MRRDTSVFVGALVATLLVVSLLGYYQVTLPNSTSSAPPSTVPSTGFVTGTSDTFFTLFCSITGIGGFQLLVASDSTGAPVHGESINAVDRLGCDSMSQVVYLDNFTVGQGGWLTPVFPNRAIPGGELSFSVTYQGGAYNFSALVPPVGTSCVTLHVPSGNVTSRVVMGSYC
jgi:hypothetical protein